MGAFRVCARAPAVRAPRRVTPTFSSSTLQSQHVKLIAPPTGASGSVTIRGRGRGRGGTRGQGVRGRGRGGGAGRTGGDGGGGALGSPSAMSDEGSDDDADAALVSSAGGAGANPAPLEVPAQSKRELPLSRFPSSDEISPFLSGRSAPVEIPTRRQPARLRLGKDDGGASSLRALLGISTIASEGASSAGAGAGAGAGGTGMGSSAGAPAPEAPVRLGRQLTFTLPNLLRLGSNDSRNSIPSIGGGGGGLPGLSSAAFSADARGLTALSRAFAPDGRSMGGALSAPPNIRAAQQSPLQQSTAFSEADGGLTPMLLSGAAPDAGVGRASSRLSGRVRATTSSGGGADFGISEGGGWATVGGGGGGAGQGGGGGRSATMRAGMVYLGSLGGADGPPPMNRTLSAGQAAMQL